MLIQRLMLNYFGKFHDLEIKLNPGINLIYGDNEAGKTTVHTFIKGMLFGMERLRGRAANSKEDLYTRYLPWSNPGAFHGSMDIVLGDREYHLQRSFHGSDRYFQVIDKATGREVPLKEGAISELIPKLTDATFRNTISIGQLKSQTDMELATEVRNYIANLSVTKSREVDVAKAQSSLIGRRKLLEGNDAKLQRQLQELRKLIEEGEEKERRYDELSLKLQELKNTEQSIRSKKEEIKGYQNSDKVKQMERFPAIMENYRTYKDLMEQKERCRKQIEELHGIVASLEKRVISLADIKKDMKEAVRLYQNILECDDRIENLRKEQKEFGKSRLKRLGFLTLTPSLVLSLIIILTAGFHGIALVASMVVLLIGLILCLNLMGKDGDKLQRLQEECKEYIRRKEALQTEYNQILHRYNVETMDILQKRQEEFYESFYALEHGRKQMVELDKRMEEIDDRRDLLYEVIMRYIKQFTTEDNLSDEILENLQSFFKLRREELAVRQQEVDRMYEDCKIRIEELKWELSAMEDNERQLLENRRKLEETERKWKENTLELEAVKLALGTIQELSIEIHDSFGIKLNNAVSDIIRDVTGLRYHDIKLDENLDIKVGFDGNYLILDKLSAGTIDQIYFALRLAVADLILGRDELPFILDDSFALYDEKRVRAALTLLSKRQQVILFSCHRREADILRELEIPFHYVEL